MRIIVISTPVFKVPVAGYSGLEHLAWQQAAGLAARGHEVSLVAPEGSECPGVTVITPGPPGSWDEKGFYAKYWQELPRFDAVIDNTWMKWSYVLKEEGVLKAPVLGVMHAPVNTMYQVLPAVERPCFVCISRDQANHFEALHSRPARVCHNGVDTDFYKPLDVPRTSRFLFLARFSTIKGPDLAIDACRKAGGGLDLVGDTSITNEPQFLEACKRQCDAEVRFVGPASRGECVWWFSRAHCLVHPNQRFREPFGLAPVEAMACGCPVIAWDYGAMRETVKDGETGILVRSQGELAEAVRRVRDHGQEFWGTKVVRSHCRDWAAQFSVQKMIDRYEKLCQEAVEGGGW